MFSLFLLTSMESCDGGCSHNRARASESFPTEAGKRRNQPPPLFLNNRGRNRISKSTRAKSSTLFLMLSCALSFMDSLAGAWLLPPPTATVTKHPRSPSSLFLGTPYHAIPPVAAAAGSAAMAVNSGRTTDACVAGGSDATPQSCRVHSKDQRVQECIYFVGRTGGARKRSVALLSSQSGIAGVAGEESGGGNGQGGVSDEPLWLGLDLSTQSLTGAVLRGNGVGGAFNDPVVLESINFEVHCQCRALDY